MNNDCIVIGGGVSGLMNAYHLNKNGMSVVVFDRDSDNIENKTSFGNAGLLSAFSKSPLSHPGVLQETIKMIFLKKSPLFFSSFPDFKTILWSLKFFLSSTVKNTKYRMSLFEKYGQESLDEYRYMQEYLHVDFEYKQDGFVSIYSDKNKYIHQKNIFDKTPEKVSCLSLDEVQELCPLIDKDKVQGAFLLHNNAQLNPAKFLLNLKKYLKEQGVVFLDEEIVDINNSDFMVDSVISSSGKEYVAKNYILATGIDEKISQKLKTNLMQISTKGYSLTLSLDKSMKPKIPIMLADKFAIFTPREKDVRITSLLELGSKSKNISQDRIDFLLSNIKEVTKDFNVSSVTPWCGFRPLTPNDKPLIGRDKKYKNFIYSMGLGWLGMTFGPSIGRIVSDLVIQDISNEESEDIMMFSGLVS